MIDFDFRQFDIVAGLWNSKTVPSLKVSKERIVTCYELELVIENGGNSFINGKKYPIKKNNFICAKPGSVRYSEFPFKCLFIRFSTDSIDIERLLSRIDDCFPIYDSTKISSLFNDLITLYTTNGNRLMICSKFTELLSLLEKENNSAKSRSLFAVEKAKAFMLENLSKKLTLSNIAEFVHFNPVYFHRIFKRETGQTPAEFLTEARIENAKKELCTTEKSITEIALESGFESSAYFGSVFKNHTEMTPKDFRKMYYNIYFSEG